MGDHSAISWTDATWNPTTGCTRVSAGCDSCYAYLLHDTRHVAWKRGRMPNAAPQYHEPFSKVQLFPDRLDLPLHWRKPRKIFVDSMADLFHDDVPDEFIDRVFAVMALAPQHTFQVLTKRAGRMRVYLTDQLSGLDKAEQAAYVTAFNQFDLRGVRHEYTGWQFGVKGRIFEQVVHSDIGRRWRQEHPSGDICGPGGLLTWPLANVWLGVSTEDQAAADARIPLLLETPAAVRFISAEPLIGPLNLLDYLHGPCLGCGRKFSRYSECEDFAPFPCRWETGIDWVIVGGESGPRARPLEEGWVREILNQCLTMPRSTKFFLKQWGGLRPGGDAVLDGVLHHAFPETAVSP